MFYAAHDQEPLMSVYRDLAADATCSSLGCLCHDRPRTYPSDLTDGQWAVLEPPARAAMAEFARATGRPMVHNLRAMLDAIAYVVRYGIEWRALPADFPPHEAVYAFLCRWNRKGLPEHLADHMRERIRLDQQRDSRPSAACLDSQSVKASDTVAAASCGYDAGKKIKGRKRHIAVDTCGLVVSVLITAASVQDRDAGMRLLALVREKLSTVVLVWADGGYAGRLLEWAHQVLRVRVEIVKRSDDARGFQVLPRRWVVERTFAWLMRYRRLVRDYERRPEQHAAMVWWATVFLMVRRLERVRRGQGPHQRWGGPRPDPTRAAAGPGRQRWGGRTRSRAGPGRQRLGPRGRWAGVLVLMGADPSRGWHAHDLARLLDISNIKSFQAQLGRWARQGRIHKIARATYTLHPTGLPT